MFFFEKLKKGLENTRQAMAKSTLAVFERESKLDNEFFEKLEESLIMGDVGVNTALEISTKLKKHAKRKGIADLEELKQEFVSIAKDILENGVLAGSRNKELSSISEFPQRIVLVVGVNGVGKTTTIGKLAYNFKNEGHSVMMAAADTFRDAATEQLEMWATRAGALIVKGEKTDDPSAVIFDAVNQAKKNNVGVLICDTAGRFQSKKNLMAQLSKMERVLEKLCVAAQKDVFLVLDATTGQNAVSQAKEFRDAVDVTGLILTKLDGTAKGGVVLSIVNELKIPIVYVGLGEEITDLEEFDPEAFAKALFD